MNEGYLLILNFDFNECVVKKSSYNQFWGINLGFINNDDNCDSISMENKLTLNILLC